MKRKLEAITIRFLALHSHNHSCCCVLGSSTSAGMVPPASASLAQWPACHLQLEASAPAPVWHSVPRRPRVSVVEEVQMAMPPAKAAVRNGDGWHVENGKAGKQ